MAEDEVQISAERLQSIAALINAGYLPVLTILRSLDDERVWAVTPQEDETLPVLLSEMANAIEELDAADYETTTPIGSPAAEAAEVYKDFVEWLDERRSDGQVPKLICFTDTARRVKYLAEDGFQKIPGFLRWLSFQYAPPVPGGDDGETL